MTAQQYLFQYKAATQEIARKQLMIKTLKSVAEKMVSELKADVVQTTREGRLTENTVLNIADEQESLDNLIELQYKIGIEIGENIMKYAPEYVTVLLRFYILDETLESIGRTCQKSKQWAFKSRKDGDAKINAAIRKNPDDFTCLSIG